MSVTIETKVGQFPKEWRGKRLVFIEPHPDDFFLNAYSLFAGMWKRNAENAPASLVVITITTSEVNHENGLRSLLGTKSTETFRQLELGFPDIIWNAVMKKEEGISSQVDSLSVLDWYNFNMIGTKNYLQNYLGYILHAETHKKASIILKPLAIRLSHPMHRAVSAAIDYIATNIPIWIYEDNPYTLKALENYSLATNIGVPYEYAHTVKLDDMDRAKKFALFCQHYSSQYTSQVMWNDAWMLRHEYETFFKVPE